MSALLIHAARRRNPQLLMQPEVVTVLPRHQFPARTRVADAAREMRSRGYALQLRGGAFVAIRIH